MNVHQLYLTLSAYRLFTRLVLHPSSCNISSLLEKLRISLRIHHTCSEAPLRQGIEDNILTKVGSGANALFLGDTCSVKSPGALFSSDRAKSKLRGSTKETA